MNIIENLQYEIDQEVELQVKNVKEQLKNQKEITNNVKKELSNLKKEIAFKRKNSILDKYSKNITIENAHKFFDMFFTPTNKVSGIDTSDKASDWFSILVKYYDNKNEVIDILECFDISGFNSSWARSFRMPYDWNKEELTAFFKKPDVMCQTNGCYLDSNVGFWKRVAIGRAPLEQISNGMSFSGIPLQLILQNKLIVEDSYLFNKIINWDYTSYSKHIYFLAIVKFQTLKPEQNDLILKKILGLTKKAKSFQHIRTSVTECLKNVKDVNLLNMVFKDEELNISISYFPDFYKNKIYKSMDMNEDHFRTIKQSKHIFSKEEYSNLVNEYKEFILNSY